MIIDWELGVGTYPRCADCTWKIVGKASPVGRMMNLLKKKYGRKATREYGRRLGSSLTTEQREEYEGRRVAAVRAKVWSAAERSHLSAATIKPRQVGKVGICRICGYITYCAEPTSKRRPGETHSECLWKYRREHQQSIGHPVYPRRPGGRRPSSKDLADTFEIAVRHLLRGEDIGRSEWEGGKGLAAEFNLSRDAVIERINIFVTRLPSDGRGGQKLARWARALREAKARAAI